MNTGQPPYPPYPPQPGYAPPQGYAPPPPQQPPQQYQPPPPQQYQPPQPPPGYAQPPQGYAPPAPPGYPPPQQYSPQPYATPGLVGLPTLQPGQTNLFAGLANAEVSERGAYMKRGVYTVRVKKAIMKTVRKGYDAFILEFLVETSNYQQALDTTIKAYGGQPYNIAELNKVLPNQVGETASWFQSLQDKSIGWGSLKGFAAEILGVDPKDPNFIRDVEGFLSAVVQVGVINNFLLPLEVITIKTKPKPGQPDGADFSRHNWGKILDQGRPMAPQGMQGQPAAG